MDAAKLKFGSGPKELCGDVDLLSYYKLWPHHEIFCKRSLPPLSETKYVCNVVGEKRIRKGDGMELDQLLSESSCQVDGSVNLQPFQLDILRDAFQITGANSSNSYAERGIHLSASELKIKKKKRLDMKNKKKKDLTIHKKNRKGSSILKENRDNVVLMRKYQPHQFMQQKQISLG